ncbi:MAG: hypothetical protein ACKVZ0_20555 [Gemmatimonadales bacterium]
MRKVVCGPLLLLALTTSVEAQTPLLVPGVRVRVTGPCLVDLPSSQAQCGVVVGRLRSWTPDSVVVRVGSGADRAVARRTARLVEVSDGIRSYRTLGTFVGAGIGLAAGLATPCTPAPSDDPGTQSLGYFSCTALRWIFVPIAVGVGAGTGRIVGSLLKSETWVSLGGEVATVGIAPRGNSSLAVVVTVRF